MADWEGFTEADLRKMQSGSSNKTDQRPKIVKPVQGLGKKLSGSSKTKQSTLGKHNTAARRSRTSVGDVSTSVNSSQQQRSVGARNKSVEDPNQKETTPSDSIKVDEPPATMKEKAVVLDDESVQKKEKLKLEDVHQRQKQMEEKNRRKKAMLTKEIAERKKKALAESSKLVKIQSELTKLDQLLNVDVSLLRDKIDDACMDFSHAQKRFEKAESEYIAAKMELHHKTILKEDLTEHLFNLIQANEERKAKKLEELMHKLDVEEEELEDREAKRKQDGEERKLSQSSQNTPDEDKVSSVKIASKDESTSSDVPESPSEASDKIKSSDDKVSSDKAPSNGESLHGATQPKNTPLS